ncbi:MAG: hypothetical protein KDA71_06755, partial [Planctomycetales bacterium]|nr:hypothetical protein [Planctomycetales bacterium]
GRMIRGRTIRGRAGRIRRRFSGRNFWPQQRGERGRAEATAGLAEPLASIESGLKRRIRHGR